MNDTVDLNADARRLVAEAAEWRLIELLFRCPSASSSSSSNSQSTAGTWVDELQSLASEVQDEELREAARCAAKEADEGVFNSIFGPGGPAPAREASYNGTIQLGYLLSELKAFYDAFAYDPRTSAAGKEPPDHVSVEAGFMSFLRFKQAFALAHGLEERAVVVEAADRFLREHLSNVAEPLSFALDHSGVAYLALAGRALLRRTGPAQKQMMDILDQDGANAETCSFECGET